MNVSNYRWSLRAERSNRIPLIIAVFSSENIAGEDADRRGIPNFLERGPENNRENSLLFSLFLTVISL
jgi:hypothetical protein